MALSGWILLIAAVGLGLSLELVFYRARLRDRRRASRSSGRNR